MKKLVLILCFFIMLSNNNEKYYYADHARSLRYEAAKEMCKRHKFLRVFGLGGGMIDQVNFVAISFSCNRKLTEHEMRELLIEGAFLLQNKINDARELRPYLSHYPYTSKGIEVAIFTYPKEKKPEELSYASLTEGEITYFNKKKFPNNVILEESFEEALAKVDVEQIMKKKEPSSMFTRIKTLFLK